MPGPFPGMDPYLETSVLWPGVHQRIITTICTVLNSLLPSDYVADIGERVYVAQPDRSVYPDVVVFEHQIPQAPQPDRAGSSLVADPPILLVVEPDEVREVFIRVLPVGDETRVVTIIELLSYANKAAG